ncbi:MAG: transglutaminase family protein [Fimbriiglobus sp.]
MVIKDLCRQLDEWAEHIRRETERCRIQFLSYPEEYEHGEPEWRMLILTSVLQKHYGIRYNPDQIKDYTWNDSRNEFIHGLLGPTRMGTCATIPVLIVAIGRRLGYPLWLCEAPGHIFTRWADRKTGVQMNIECHGNGMAVCPDDHYRRWPIAWTEPVYARERELGPYRRYLRPVEPWETLAVLLVQRGHVWEAIGRWGEATAAYNAACELVPYNKVYAVYASEAWRRMVDPDYVPFRQMKWQGVTPDYSAYETKEPPGESR